MVNYNTINAIFILSNYSIHETNKNQLKILINNIINIIYQYYIQFRCLVDITRVVMVDDSNNQLSTICINKFSTFYYMSI